MTYKENSNWNDVVELRCLIIYKQLKDAGFPKGMQSNLCSKLVKKYKLSNGSLSAKVSNFKSVAGDNNPSNASQNTIRIFRLYSKKTIDEIEKVIKELE